ncbi:hypothetical protein MMC10_002260 [Thelotrema lepadinum]|nr:hypothetical protein [Thelotrema lepadinum]
MSFSYGIGDALAIINLIERVVVEVRNYRDAPRYFQHLALELQLLQRALQRLLEVEACDDSELRQLEEIRAIAMHCRQPLLDFCDKMRSSEAGLGSMQSTRTLSAIGKRLHWSLVTRKDVDALRQAVVSEMTTINMLLALQQLDSIKKLISLNDQANTSTIHLREFCSVSSEYFMTSMGIMKEVGRTSAAIEQFSDIVSRKLADHDRSAHQIREEVTRVSASMSSLTVFAQSVSNLTRSMEGYVTRMLRTVASLASDLGKIVMMIAQLSKRVAKKLASQG